MEKGIYVKMIDPLKSFIASQAILDLNRFMIRNAHHYDELGSRTMERCWIDDEQNAIDVETERNGSGTSSEELKLSFLELKNGVVLIREAVYSEAYNPKLQYLAHDRYYLMEGSKMIKQPSRIKKIVKDELGIKIPGIRMKSPYNHVSNYIAEFLTKPGKIETVIDC